MTNDKLSRILARLEERWSQPLPDQARRLLRLSLARELSRAVHTLRSELMAMERQEDAAQLARRETALLGSLRSSRLALEALSLRELYQGTPPSTEIVPPKEPLLPAELARSLDPGKLKRHDRAWEAEICQEALARGWSFWRFEASVDIHGVEEFARFFSEGLWPRGVVLFVESDGFLRSGENEPDRAFWRGRWILVLEPSLEFPSELPGTLSAELSSRWPGADPRWTRLYPLS